MAQGTVNERIKNLITSLGMSTRAFSASIGVADTTTRNYIDRGTNPKSEYLTKILRQYKQINSNWLFTGEGEMFLPGATESNSTVVSAPKNKGNIQGTNRSTNTINNLNIEDCRRELENVQRELASLRREMELQTALLASKEETITLLRASTNRPN